MSTPNIQIDPAEMISLNETSPVIADEEDEMVLLDEVMTNYGTLLGNFKELTSRTAIVRQTRNFPGVAGPIYSTEFETSVALQPTPPTMEVGLQDILPEVRAAVMNMTSNNSGY